MAFVGGITHSEKSEGKGREKKERERKGISKSHPKAWFHCPLIPSTVIHRHPHHTTPSTTMSSKVGEQQARNRITAVSLSSPAQRPVAGHAVMPVPVLARVA
jgi:hypothetical protein